MSFWPSSLKVHRVTPTGVALLAGFCLLGAANIFAEPIQIVPAKGATISTNINQRESEPRKRFEAMSPDVATPFIPDESTPGIMLPPAQTRTLTAREKELLDRRRNWVFMTPEELMSEQSPESMLGLKQYDKDGREKESTTAMERYYDRLAAANRDTATNRLDRDSDSWSSMTNTFTGGTAIQDNARPFESPFNSTPPPEVFHAMRPESFSDVFGVGSDTTTPTPEMVQAKKDEEAHMESFKQVWDIDQPSPPAPASFAGSSAPASGGSGADAFPSMQPVLGIASPSIGGSPSQPNTMSSPPAPIHATPPRPNFTMPQRQF